MRVRTVRIQRYEIGQKMLRKVTIVWIRESQNPAKYKYLSTVVAKIEDYQKTTNQLGVKARISRGRNAASENSDMYVLFVKSSPGTLQMMTGKVDT